MKLKSFLSATVGLVALQAAVAHAAVPTDLNPVVQTMSVGSADTDPDWVKVAAHRGSTMPIASSNCPKGNLEPLDGCADAPLGASYIDPNMFNMFKDENGNTAILAVTPGADFNVAGRDFAIAPVVPPGGFKDPYFYGFRSTNSNVNGTTFTAGTVLDGEVHNGLKVWSSPGTAGLITNPPTLSNCSGGTPTPGKTGTVCTISISQTNKTGPYNGSENPGCNWTSNGTSLAQWRCDFRYPNHGVTATFDGYEWDAVGGHGGTVLFIDTLDNGIPTLVLKNNNFKIHASTDGTPHVRTNPGIPVNLVATNNECNGGNAAVATGALPADIPFRIQSPCISWSASGSVGAPTTNYFARNWIHDYGGNPIQINAGWSNTVSQANVFYRNHMNDGNIGAFPAPGANGFHGASINWNTTSVGSVGSIKRYGDVVITPYGFRHGVITAPFAILGGIGSGISIDYEQRLTTSITNRDNLGPQYAPAEAWIDFLRIGYISNVKIQKNFTSTLGNAANGCFIGGADMSRNYNSSMAAVAGQGYSIYSINGMTNPADAGPVIVPGQTLSVNLGSQTTEWVGVMTDLLDGTSRMDISFTQVGSTTNLPLEMQVVALRMADPMTNPTLIKSKLPTPTPGFTASYIVSNGSGQGENRASQYFRLGQTLKAFGSCGTTATGGTSKLNYNGTWCAGGENTVATSTTFVAMAPLIGNRATIDTDISDNYDVITGAALTVDGIALNRGNCPGTGI